MENLAQEVVVVPLQELNQSENIECKTPPPPFQKIEDIQNSVQKSSEEKNQQIGGVENYANANGVDSFCKCKVSAGLVATPDRLKLPKPFKFPERYTSPTDHMMSPITKGLLARKTKRGALLPPSIIQSKIQELQSPNVEQIQLHKEQS